MTTRLAWIVYILHDRPRTSEALTAGSRSTCSQIAGHPTPTLRPRVHQDLNFSAIITSGSRELLLSHSVGMASPEIHHLFHHPIADHSFSADRRTLAVARDNNVELYSKAGSKFTLHDELKGHDKTVTGVDIAPSTGRIVTCSQGMLRANWS